MSNLYFSTDTFSLILLTFLKKKLIYFILFFNFKDLWGYGLRNPVGDGVARDRQIAVHKVKSWITGLKRIDKIDIKYEKEKNEDSVSCK